MWLLILLMVVIILALIERRINLQLEEKQSLQRMREIHSKHASFPNINRDMHSPPVVKDIEPPSKP